MGSEGTVNTGGTFLLTMHNTNTVMHTLLRPRVWPTNSVRNNASVPYSDPRYTGDPGYFWWMEQWDNFREIAEDEEEDYTLADLRARTNNVFSRLRMWARRAIAHAYCYSEHYAQKRRIFGIALAAGSRTGLGTRAYSECGRELV